MTLGESPALARLECFLSIPFLHRLSRQELAEANVEVSTGWQHWFERVRCPGLSQDQGDDFARAVDYSYFFLPHIRRLLFPELEITKDVAPDDLVSRMPGAGSTASEVRSAFLGGRIDGALQNCSVRLTWKPDDPLLGSTFCLNSENAPKTEFTIEWIDALLFPQHVGSLVMKVRATSAVGVDEAAPFLRVLRKSRYRRRLTVAVPEVVVKDSGLTYSWSDIVDSRLGSLESPDHAAAQLVRETLGTTFKSFVVATLATSDASSNSPLFTDLLEETAFALGTGHVPSTPVDVYSQPGMERLRERNILALWSNWRALGYDEGMTITLLGGADGDDSSPVARAARNVHEIAEWSYVPCHVLATMQFVRLHLLFRDLASLSPQLRDAMNAIEEFEAQFVRFRQVLWHAEVTSAPVGGAVYDICRDIYRLDFLNSSLQSDIDVVRSHLGLRRERIELRNANHTTSVLEFLTFVGAPVGLALTVLQTTTDGLILPWFEHRKWLAPIILLAVWLLAILGFATFRRLGRGAADGEL